MQAGHNKMLQRDISGSRGGDPMRVQVDRAHLELDEAEMSYYGAKISGIKICKMGVSIYPHFSGTVLEHKVPFCNCPQLRL